MKVCSKCKQNKCDTDFSKRAYGKSGLQSWCKECHHIVDKIRQKTHKKKTADKQFHKRRKLEHRQFIFDYLNEHPCIDCGESDPVVLEFDHRENKLFGIGSVQGPGTSRERITKEIAKCDVRCVNCHRRKTAKERGYFRTAA
jgi:hypothetical protein